MRVRLELLLRAFGQFVERVRPEAVHDAASGPLPRGEILPDAPHMRVPDCVDHDRNLVSETRDVRNKAAAQRESIFEKEGMTSCLAHLGPIVTGNGGSQCGSFVTEFGSQAL
jgi:hypothetical protein